MATHDFTITLPAHGHHSKIWMDGEPLTGARAVTVHTAVDAATTVTVEFVNCTATIEGEADLHTIREVTEFGDEHRHYKHDENEER